MPFEKYESRAEISTVFERLAGTHAPSRGERVRVALGSGAMVLLLLAVPAVAYPSRLMPNITWLALAISASAGACFFVWSCWRYSNTEYRITVSELAYHCPFPIRRWAISIDSVSSITRFPSRDGETLAFYSVGRRTRYVPCLQSIRAALDSRAA